ncbi:uncharacterized protein, partial [Clytia hemisphaerica]|uniref:uncharacterized protein n=1 Tax=Clytia hemisphaerica TaxID=252671 RepID=UPI0034D5570D
VLKVIADAVRVKIREINDGKKTKVRDLRQPIPFHREGKLFKASREKTINDPDWDGLWTIVADLAGEEYNLPVETTKRPDLVMYCTDRKVLKYFELTVCWEAGMEAARIRKEDRYDQLVKNCKEQGWNVTCIPFEVGVRGFVGHRTIGLLKHLSFNRTEGKKMVEQIEETVENASRFIWTKRDVAN